MADQVQCDNCGAVLAEEDIFCGECGAPHPSLDPTTGPAEGKLPADTPPAGSTPADATPAPRPAPPPHAPPRPRPARPPRSAETGWRVAVIILAGVAAVMCLVGIAAFLLFGLTESEGYSPEENWLYATFCCLLPIAGTGAILALTAGGIWFTRLRDR